MIMGVPVAVPVKWKIEFCWTLLQPFESFNRSTLHQCAFAGKLQIWVCNFHGQLKVSKAGMFDFGETDLRNRLKQTLQQTLQQTPLFVLLLEERDPSYMIDTRPNIENFSDVFCSVRV